MVKNRLLLGAAGCALMGLLSTAAFAQDAAEGDAAGAETVIVTGTHIAQVGFTSPTPVMAVTADTIGKVAPNLGDALAQLPSVRASGPQQKGGGVGSGFGGFSTVNLRSLNANRTLVLLDGDRFVPANADGSPDTNLFPSALIQRIDVVTGGASAAYGSDAVSGVANFIINKNYDGFDMQAESGISTYGDAAEYKVSLTGGMDFDGGRGHIEGNIERQDAQGLRLLDRNYTYSGANFIPNTGAAAGQPKNLIVTDALSTTATLGGLVVSSTKVGGGSSTALKGTAFGGAGTPYAFQYGNTVGSTWMRGGGAINGLTGYPASLAGGGIYGLTGNLGLVSPLQRNNFYGRVSYNIDNDTVVHADLLAGTSHSNLSPGYNYATGAPLAPVIRLDNAYLPAATRAAMVTAGLQSITLGKSLDELSYRANGMDTTYRASIGVDFKLGHDWIGSASYEHGKTLYSVHFEGMAITPNYVMASDAVAVTAGNVGTSGLALGSIVCRTTLSAPGNGCVPYNNFGVNQASAAARKYTTGSEFDSTQTQQDAFAVNASGPLFHMWAGPVSGAIGLDYRRDAYSQRSDALSVAYNAATASNGLWRSGNTQPSSGSNQVTEGYLEFLVPLAKDLSFAKDLNIDLAARETDYQLSGSATTWKVGVNYQPLDDLRLRLTRSHDIRAPTLGELFLNGGQNASTSGLTIPTAGGGTATTTTGTRQQNIGNTDLKPEKSDTLTYGAVYSPSWLENFNVSVDAYAINISDAIGTLNATNEAQLCNQGSAQNCNFFQYNGNLVTVVTIQPFNFSTAKADGVDFEQQYSMQMSDIQDSWDGSLSIHTLASYVSHLSTSVPIAGTIDRAGDLGPNNGVPHWKGTMQFDYRQGAYDGFLQLRYTGSGKYNNTYVQGLDVNTNQIPSITYVDLNLRYTLPDTEGTWSGFVGINNALNQKAPLDPSTGSNGSYTQSAFYDQIGRYFRIGVDVKL